MSDILSDILSDITVIYIYKANIVGLLHTERSSDTVFLFFSWLNSPEQMG